jgi:predicted permease
MPPVLAVLVVTVPFFALVLCGYLATRLRWLPQPSIPGLNTFVLYFALPCLLFRFGATTPVLRYLNPVVVGVYLPCSLVLILLTMVATRRGRIGWNDAAFGTLTATFPNTGYMGVPMLVALFGAQAAGPAIVTILIDLLFTSTVCVGLSRWHAAGGHSARAAVLPMLRGIAVNPMPWAIVIGIAVGASGLALPGPVTQTIGLLADAASPVALFTIGAVLARSQMTADHPMPVREYVPPALLKLVLHPLLVLGAGTAAIRAGVPLDPFALRVLVLVAALPSASNVAMLAEKFGADTGRVARIILVSTALAFLTFSGAVALMR